MELLKVGSILGDGKPGFLMIKNFRTVDTLHR